MFCYVYNTIQFYYFCQQKKRKINLSTIEPESNETEPGTASFYNNFSRSDSIRRHSSATKSPVQRQRAS